MIASECLAEYWADSGHELAEIRSELEAAHREPPSPWDVLDEWLRRCAQLGVWQEPEER